MLKCRPWNCVVLPTDMFGTTYIGWFRALIQYLRLWSRNANNVCFRIRHPFRVNDVLTLMSLLLLWVPILTKWKQFVWIYHAHVFLICNEKRFFRLVAILSRHFRVLLLVRSSSCSGDFKRTYCTAHDHNRHSKRPFPGEHMSHRNV
jgi:hypothetical protein